MHCCDVYIEISGIVFCVSWEYLNISDCCLLYYRENSAVSHYFLYFHQYVLKLIMSGINVNGLLDTVLNFIDILILNMYTD
jgi:hypothetical protein